MLVIEKRTIIYWKKRIFITLIALTLHPVSRQVLGHPTVNTQNGGVEMLRVRVYWDWPILSVTLLSQKKKFIYIPLQNVRTFF